MHTVSYFPLANGLRLVTVQRPHLHRAVIAAYVSVGSRHETPATNGLSHFLEHMLFNGTTRFKGQDIVNFLERNGMEFGADVNASTSFDETVYMLKISTDDKKTVETAFDILQDWTNSATIASRPVASHVGVCRLMV